jgi:hypothetical protein
MPMIFFYFLKIILTSAHQNDPKHTKHILNFLGTPFAPHSQTVS